MTDHPATADPHWHHHDVPREARPFQGESAGVVTRGFAAVSDALVVLAFGGLIWLGSGAVAFILSPAHFTFPSPTVGLSMVTLGVIAWIYLTVGWSTSGRTVGNQLLGLRVVTTRGRRLRLGVSALRALAYIFFPIGLLWSAVSHKRKSLQDMVLRTDVVYDWHRTPTTELSE
jgi:uncharacterized RDD family membrane protein YckC